MMLCIKNGTIHTVAEKDPFVGDILVAHGKIVKIGQNLASEADHVVDATGLQVYPGLIDCHSHLGLDGYGIRFEGQDYNEYTDSITPHLEAIDAFNPQDITVKMAALAGVTCVATGPGSSNVLGGTFIVVKTTGNRVEDMLVKRKSSMKCAFGENPKFCYKDKDNASRMSIAAKLRNMFNKTIEYKNKLEAAGDDISKKPAYDQKLEALIPVLNREIPLKAHAHRADDIFTAIRIAKEFNLRVTIEHCTEGHLIAEELAKENVPVAVGPTLGHATKFEVKNKTWETPDILVRAGCMVSIITDAPVIPQQHLALCASMAVKAGMDKYEALKAITINPATHMGVSDRVGTLEVGKDADIIITDGCVLDNNTNVLHTYIDGNLISRD